MTFDDVKRLGLAFPGVEVSTSYGTPALKVRGKMLTRLKEDGESIVLHTPFVVRDHLMHTSPKVFYITDHYRDYPAVLARLKFLKATVLKELLEDTWRANASAKQIRELDDK